MVDKIIDDDRLVEGLRRGEKKAHSQLWQKYGDILIRFLQSKGAEPEDAADAAVEAVARAVEKIDQFDPSRSKGQAPFRNWLFTIARNIWHDYQRNQHRVVSLERDEEFLGSQSLEVTTDPPKQKVDALNRALSILPDKQRQIIIMHFYDDMPLSQIAQVLGVPDSTVRQWKRRALTTLKTALMEMPVFASMIDPENL